MGDGCEEDWEAEEASPASDASDSVSAEVPTTECKGCSSRCMMTSMQARFNMMSRKRPCSSDGGEGSEEDSPRHQSKSDTYHDKNSIVTSKRTLMDTFLSNLQND